MCLVYMEVQTGVFFARALQSNGSDLVGCPSDAI